MPSSPGDLTLLGERCRHGGRGGAVLPSPSRRLSAHRGRLAAPTWSDRRLPHRRVLGRPSRFSPVVQQALVWAETRSLETWDLTPGTWAVTWRGVSGSTLGQASSWNATLAQGPEAQRLGRLSLNPCRRGQGSSKGFRHGPEGAEERWLPQPDLQP